MGNFSSYAIVALIVIIISLCVNIYLNRAHINELQNEVKNGIVALDYQNKMIENNRVKNEALQDELMRYTEQVKRDFAKIQIGTNKTNKPQNECEVFLKDLAGAWQK